MSCFRNGNERARKCNVLFLINSLLRQLRNENQLETKFNQIEKLRHTIKIDSDLNLLDPNNDNESKVI